MPRRTFLRVSVGAAAGFAGGGWRSGLAQPAGAERPVDLAKSEFRDLWLHHPCVGDASFDSFVRLPRNPIYRGSPPYEWPVNGFLFEDPRTRWWYAYVGLYPRGYWPPGGCRALLSKDRGASWEDLGIVLTGSPATFDGDGKNPGGTPDVSVCYAEGAYHLIYDWAKPDNSDGGLAYARADRPEGPFIRADDPLHAESRQPLILGKYKRVYAPTLFKRENDWLILADMSTARNAGGTWALIAMTAKSPAGPYSPPELLLYPQSHVFHPAPIEFYPCFAHKGDIFVPATSVGANRSFQTLFRAPLERAHTAAAWKIDRLGSGWHDEPVEWEARGLWGQTFSGFVDTAGSLKALFPSKDSQDRGTINLAERAWNLPDRDGFVLSAPNGPAVSLLLKEHRDFELEAEARSSSGWRLVWNHNGPLGTNRIWHADGGPHPLVFSDCTELATSAGGWELRQRNHAGETSVLGRARLPPQARLSGSLAQGNPPAGSKMSRRVVNIRQHDGRLFVEIDGREIWKGEAPARSGSIGFVAEAPGILYIDRLLLSNLGESCTKFFLSTDAILGAASGLDGWTEEKSGLYKFRLGYASSTPGIAVKWNYRGRGFRLWSPRGLDFGRARVRVDGQDRGEVSFFSKTAQASLPVFEVTDLPLDYHAVTLTQISGRLPCDCLEIFL
jgi:hypothetical protein